MMTVMMTTMIMMLIAENGDELIIMEDDKNDEDKNDYDNFYKDFTIVMMVDATILAQPWNYYLTVGNSFKQFVSDQNRSATQMSIVLETGYAYGHC